MLFNDRIHIFSGFRIRKLQVLVFCVFLDAHARDVVRVVGVDAIEKADRLLLHGLGLSLGHNLRVLVPARRLRPFAVYRLPSTALGIPQAHDQDLRRIRMPIRPIAGFRVFRMRMQNFHQSAASLFTPARREGEPHFVPRWGRQSSNLPAGRSLLNVFHAHLIATCHRLFLPGRCPAYRSTRHHRRLR